MWIVIYTRHFSYKQSSFSDVKTTSKLAGRTIFITGASRGIGEAIALKCAKDGANVVIAAKTADPHPKLPGTIYTVAEQIEKAGGKALPCIVNVQSEEQVEKAVSDTVNKFGGIDILINNASAIHLTGTVETPMKRYDLMHSINTRGTYLCSKYCVPHLKKGVNPHILNISPPLNMNPRWFKDHVAYTMAKYGMSMCVLGMADEFKTDGIAVNALWPQTAIYTAAMAMLGGGEGVKSQCRTPDIMADSAYAILTKDSKSFTGNFCIDEDILKKEGMTNLEQYACVPGGNLLPDFFLEEESPDGILDQMQKGGGSPAFNKTSASMPATPSASIPVNSGNPQIDETFTLIQAMLSEDIVAKTKAVYGFDLKESGEFHLDLKNAGGAAGQGGPPQGKADVTFTMGPKAFVDMFAGKINPTTAFMTGKMKIKGDLGLAMKLEKLMKQMRSSKL